MIPPVSLGPALYWSDEMIALMAVVTEEDIEAARRLWRQDAEPVFRRLLDAAPEEDADAKTIQILI